MFPIICQIGPLKVYSYGLMLAVAVIVCTFFLVRDAEKENIRRDFIVDLVFYCVVAGLIGARLFYILLNLEYYLVNPSEIIMIHKGGLAVQGGIIFGIIAGIFFARIKKQNVLFLLDIIAPYMALGHAIGRIGCFFNGCCYGKILPWGIYFPVHGAHLHPTQLYDAAGLAGIFIILKMLSRRNKGGGFVFAAYIILTSVLRFGIEFLRADHYVEYFGLSVYQFVCLGLIVSACIFYAYLKSRQRQ